MYVWVAAAVIGIIIALVLVFKYTKTGKNDVLIPDASANLIWAMQSFKVKGQKIFTALNHSPMGYSMPATIGAYLADKTKNVVETGIPILVNNNNIPGATAWYH